MIVVTRRCLNCGAEVESEVYKDELGEFAYCPECGSSFDIDLKEEK